MLLRKDRMKVPVLIDQKNVLTGRHGITEDLTLPKHIASGVSGVIIAVAGDDRVHSLRHGFRRRQRFPAEGVGGRRADLAAVGDFDPRQVIGDVPLVAASALILSRDRGILITVELRVL